MTTEMEQTVEAAEEVQEVQEYVEYVQRRRGSALQLPQELEAEAPVPPSWMGTAREWEMVRRRAVDAFKERPAYDFGHSIAVRGLFVDEVLTGQLRRGSKLNAITGKVVRPPVTKASSGQVVAARDLLRDLQGRGIVFDPILMADLERIAYGAWTGDDKRVRVVIHTAESVVNVFDAARRAAVAQEQQKPRLTVRFAFKAMGREYPQGEHRITPEEAEQLTDWMDRMLAQAEQHDWDYPEGFGEMNWPPFTISEPFPS